MKKILLIFFFLSAFPQFSKAETVYLIISTRMGNTGSTNVIPMDNKEKCELSGAQLKSSKRFNPFTNSPRMYEVGYECVTGK